MITDYKLRFFGDPILKRPAQKITKLDNSILEIARAMLSTMKSHKALGLAAQQIGVAYSLIVLNMKLFEDIKYPEDMILVNPKIIYSEGSEIGEEGCLSLPGIFLNIFRPQYIIVDAQLLKNGQLKPFSIKARGLCCRVLCHEIDHLNGILITDIAPSRKVMEMYL